MNLKINISLHILFSLVMVMALGAAVANATTPLPTASVNWAGYIVASNTLSPSAGSVNSVSGSWIVQNVTQSTHPLSYSSQWVGIDGAINQYLIQTGTESDSATAFGQPSYYAWWELIPSPETPISNFTVEPGDVMYANITLVNPSNNIWTIQISDITRNEIFSINQTYVTPETSAEWIDERTYVGGFPPLADFHSAYYGSQYTGAPNQDNATINGISSNLANVPNVAINLYNVDGIGEEVALSPLSSNGSFSLSIPLTNATVYSTHGGIDKGASVQLSGNPFGGMPPYTYQWYTAPSHSSSFGLLDNSAQNYTFATTSSTQSGLWQFKVTATDSTGNTITSQPADILVNGLPNFNSGTGTSATEIALGGNFTVSSNLPINGTKPYEYQWYSTSPGTSSFSPIPGANPLSFDNASPGLYDFSGYAAGQGQCLYYNGYIYCIPHQYVSDTGVQSMFVTVNNGTLGTWQPTTIYPQYTASESCVQDYGYAYCTGGLNASSTFPYQIYATNYSYYATLSANGIGPWTKTLSYPSQIYASQCVEYNNYIYCTGGITGGRYSANSFYAPLTPNGIGAWQQTTNYTGRIAYSSCTESTGYIYCVGGQGDNFYPLTNDTFYAALTNNGIGQWTQTTSYPTPILDGSCNAAAGYIYCNSGVNMTKYTNQSYYAPLLGNGAIGGWNQSGTYGVPLGFNSCVAVGNYQYCNMGCNGPVLISSESTFIDCSVIYPYDPTYSMQLLPLNYLFKSNSNTVSGIYQFELQAQDSGGAPFIDSMPISVGVNAMVPPTTTVTTTTSTTSTTTIPTTISTTTTIPSTTTTIAPTTTIPVVYYPLIVSTSPLYSSVGNSGVPQPTCKNATSGVSLSCNGSYPSGSQIEIDIPASASCLSTSSNYQFSSWSSLPSGSSASEKGTPCYNYAQLTLDGATSVVANYKLKFTSAVSPSAGGTVSPQSGYEPYLSSVNLHVSPTSAYSFGSWTCTGTGCYSGSSSTETLKIQSPTSQTAHLNLIPTYAIYGSVTPSQCSPDYIGNAAAIVNGVKVSNTAGTYSGSLQKGKQFGLVANPTIYLSNKGLSGAYCKFLYWKTTNAADSNPSAASSSATVSGSGTVTQTAVYSYHS